MDAIEREVFSEFIPEIFKDLDPLYILPALYKMLPLDFCKRLRKLQIFNILKQYNSRRLSFPCISISFPGKKSFHYREFLYIFSGIFVHVKFEVGYIISGKKYSRTWIRCTFYLLCIRYCHLIFVKDFESYKVDMKGCQSL
jgi:hypothetical protein